MKPSETKPSIPKPGTILYYAIGCGCTQFWQVKKSTAKSVVVGMLNNKVVNRNLKYQTCDYLPVKDSFEQDVPDKVLRVAPDGRIGPLKRLLWWGIWDGKPSPQWSP